MMGIKRVSLAQVESYASFLGPAPLEHPLFGLLATLGVDPHRFARDGIRGTAEGHEIDAYYIRLWDAWAARQSPVPPEGHRWVKGTVATGLVLAERHRGTPR